VNVMVEYLIKALFVICCSGKLDLPEAEKIKNYTRLCFPLFYCG
jgi:hypothetical protein